MPLWLEGFLYLFESLKCYSFRHWAIISFCIVTNSADHLVRVLLNGNGNGVAFI